MSYRNPPKKPKGYPVKARSREEIEEVAFSLRAQMGFSRILYFPIVEYLEFVLPELHLAQRSRFSLEVYGADDEDAKHPGITNVKANTIRLRQDVYDLARRGTGWARGIAAHELGHLLLEHEVLFAKLSGEPTHSFEEDSEWQANVFYGGLLASPRLVKKLNACEIEKACGISRKAAQYNVRARLEDKKLHR